MPVRFPIAVLLPFLVCIAMDPSQAQQGIELGSASPHGDGQYVGLTKCAACHFDQYKDWKGSEHNRAFEILPAKYRTDASCLECHTTATATDTASHQFGVSCESCHGPGGEHAKFALRFVNEVISEEGLKNLREKIHRVDMLQCVKCHVSKAHKKHPPFDREETLPEPQAIETRSSSFFDAIHGRKTEPIATTAGEQPYALAQDSQSGATARSDIKQNDREQSRLIGTQLVKEDQ